MNQSNKMPSTGQFVAVYMHEDRPWAQTLKWSNDGKLLTYNETDDEFEPFEVSLLWIEKFNPVYFTA